jgi:N-acetylneuraminate lyase
MTVSMADRARLSGLHAALVTPYDADGEISDTCLREVVGYALARGMDGLYVGGSTGEALLQTPDERRRIFALVAEARGEAALIGHVGAIGAREARYLAKACAEFGYDAISAIPPIYFQHSADAIRGYYAGIIEAGGGLPLIVYNVPAMSNVKLGFDDLAKLIELPGVIGVKQTTADMYQMERLRRTYPDLVLLNGFDEMLLAGLVSGASGAIGSTFNIMGRRYRALWDAVKKGDTAGALAIQNQCNAVIDVLIALGVFPAVKYSLWKLGVIATPVCRAPLATLDDTTAARLAPVVEEIRRQDAAGLSSAA